MVATFYSSKRCVFAPLASILISIFETVEMDVFCYSLLFSGRMDTTFVGSRGGRSLHQQAMCLFPWTSILMGIIQVHCFAFDSLLDGYWHAQFSNVRL